MSICKENCKVQKLLLWLELEIIYPAEVFLQQLLETIKLFVRHSLLYLFLRHEMICLPHTFYLFLQLDIVCPPLTFLFVSATWNYLSSSHFCICVCNLTLFFRRLLFLQLEIICPPPTFLFVSATWNYLSCVHFPQMCPLLILHSGAAKPLINLVFRCSTWIPKHTSTLIIELQPIFCLIWQELVVPKI